MTFEQALQARYAGVRARLFNMPPPTPKPVLRRPYVPLDLSPPKVEVVAEPEPEPAPLDPQQLRNLPNWRRIALEVSVKHGVSLADMRSINRRAAFVAARQEAYYRIRTETTLSFPQIAALFGGRDHTTILHGARRYAERHGLPLRPPFQHEAVT